MKYLLSSFLYIIMAVAIMSCSNTPSNEFYLFVGTYTDEASEGIYIYRFNSDDGSVDSVGAATGVENPSYLALSPDDSFLYAVNEIGDSSAATVSSFSFDKREGNLKFLNKQSSRGGAPCYVAVDHSGQAVFVGNYVGGSLAMLPIREDGSLGEAVTAIQHTGSSVNKDRQSSPHVHFTNVSPDNELLLVNDLGTEQVLAYPFDEQDVTLGEEPVISFETALGAGPRHLTFHPNGRFLYIINELDGTIDALGYTENSLSHLQTISTLPEGYRGTISGADIHLSPDGRFLYASNREDLNNIVFYEVDQETGVLNKKGEVSSGGIHPRNFMIDPTGKYLLVANRHTDNIVIFERDKETGQLSATGKEIPVSQPVSLRMLSAI